jgi:hypothetical protein
MAAEMVDGVSELDAGDWDRGEREVRGREGDGVEWACADRENTTGLT